MSSDHFSKVRELFALALEQPASEHEAFVRERASDPAIAAEVLRLMGLDEQPQIHTLQGVQAMADAEAAPLAQGRRVGKFELFDVLGEGGMGQVYRARRVDGPEHWVALKLMRRGLFNAASETRFLAEQQFLARLNHPNIAHYIDSGSDADGHVYVAMELVQGQRLLDFAKAQQLNAKQRVMLFRQLLAAVSYAHRQLIIHRDLKQANVLVTTDGVVKLLDFGIAKLLQDQSQMTGTIERLYTPTCAAPEQIRGEPCDVTTDVYALGVLLYELIAGKSIFDTEGKTPGEFENLVLNVPPPDMKSRVHPELGCTDIPTDLERIVAKAIRKEPNRRYGSVEQFDADLERLLNNEPVSVSGNGFLYRTQKFLSRNKLASALTSMIAIAVLSGLVITLQQNREIRAERDRANLALDAMKQAFLGADPGGEAGGEVTARQILERSTETVLPLLKQQGPDFSGVASVLFEVQVSMGHLEDAGKIATAAGNDVVLADVRFCLLSARLLVEQRQFQAAEARVKACPLPQTRSEVILRELVKGRIAVRRSTFEDAIKTYEAVLPMLSIENPDWVYANEQYAYSLAMNGDVKRASAVVASAYDAASKQLSHDHPTIARIALAKLLVLQAAGRDEEVVGEAPRLIADITDRLGPKSILLGRAHAMVGESLMMLSPIEDAVQPLQHALEVYSSIYGPNHIETLRREANLLLTHLRSKNPPSDLSNQFESLLVKSSGPENASFRAFVEISYGHWLSKSGDQAGALRRFSAVDPAFLSRVSNEDKEIYSTWLTYAYWKYRCSDDPTKTYSQPKACGSIPAFTNLCISAREALCSDRTSELYLATHPGIAHNLQ